jgi:hypothetical protein
MGARRISRVIGGMRADVALMLLAGAIWCPAPALAAVTVSFYSRETLGVWTSAWHAFFHVEGRLDRGGVPIDANYSFSPVSAERAALFGSVPGRMTAVDKAYVAKSRRHFSLTVSDATYYRLMSLVHDWGSRRRAYNVNTNNSVHFIAEAAAITGLKVTPAPALMKKPKSFLIHVFQDNAQRFATNR